MVAKRAPKAALGVYTGIAENGGPSNNMFVVDLEEKRDGDSSAKATLNRGFAKSRDENAL